MTISHDQLILGIENKNGFPLDPEQRRAILYGDGPLLIAAGPGTGKTEVLVSRCLKFICCDSVDPQSIMLTTFTEKAARNLEDRLAESFGYLATAHPQIKSIDYSGLRVGTLHSLCNDILQEHRYTKYQNARLLDDMENSLLIHKSVVDGIDHLKSDILSQFDYIFGRKPHQKLTKWDWALALLVKLFNRIVEDQLDLDKLRVAGGAWQALHEAHRIYEEALSSTYSCDFSHLLRYFQEFLDTGQGDAFMIGESDIRPPLTHVLVDEYQDTNPIQESIYHKLCDAAPHNLTVVGDDDQALYRFRGGTVECMVGFDSACRARWNVAPQVVYLSDNHRSDGKIVKWLNEYITSFPQMRAPNVRIQGKPPLNPASGRTGSHPAFGLIQANRVKDLHPKMALLVSDLKTKGIIQDYSQCALLLPSAKNTPWNAGPYMDALENRGIPVYNPRSKDFLEQEEVAQCLGRLYE